METKATSIYNIPSIVNILTSPDKKYVNILACKNRTTAILSANKMARISPLAKSFLNVSMC